MHQQERRRVWSISRDMQKVQVVIRPRDLELREGVQACFLRAPIERHTPIFDEAAKIIDIRPVSPRLSRRRIGKTGARETLAQVGNVAVGYAQCERLRHRLLFGLCFADDSRIKAAASQTSPHYGSFHFVAGPLPSPSGRRWRGKARREPFRSTMPLARTLTPNPSPVGEG